MELTERKMALIFKALCEENRIRIMKLLRAGEQCACKLSEELNISQYAEKWGHDNPSSKPDKALNTSNVYF